MFYYMGIDAKAFGKQLQKARERAQLTQDDVIVALAEKGFPMTQGAYSHYEKGRRFPDPPVIAALSEIVHASADYLLLLTTEAAPVKEIMEELAMATGGAKINKLMEVLPKDRQQQVVSYAQFLSFQAGSYSAETRTSYTSDIDVAAAAKPDDRSLSDQLALRALFAVIRRRLGEDELNKALEEVTELAPEWEDLIASTRRTSKDSGIQGS